MQGKAGKNEFPKIVTVTEAARFLGKDIKTVKKKIENLAPVHREGNSVFYSALDLISAYFVQENEDEKEGKTLTQARTEFYIEQTLKTRLIREKLAGKYVDIGEFHQRHTKRYYSFKEKLLNVSSKLAPKVSKTDSETAFRLMNEAICEALAELVEDEIEELEL